MAESEAVAEYDEQPSIQKHYCRRQTLPVFQPSRRTSGTEGNYTVTFEFLGETITVIGAGHFLVASHSHLGEHYAVCDDQCTCRASDCLVECRHLRAVRKLQYATYIKPGLEHGRD